MSSKDKLRIIAGSIAALVLLLLIGVFKNDTAPQESYESTETVQEEKGTEIQAETYEIPTIPESEEKQDEPAVTEDGKYTSRDEVALYIHTYGHLPKNFITKKEAEEKGWDTSKKLGDVLPGMSIGGTYFGNYEDALPEKQGRDYYECDIDYSGGKRNAKRIVYSNDGLIFYTDDHYETFEQLY